MEITNKDVKVLGRVVAITTDNIVASAEQVYDENFDGGQHQNVINKHFLDTDTTLDKKIDTLQSYVDDTFVPLDGAVMNDEASLQFSADDCTSSIDGTGLSLDKENTTDTKNTAVVFNQLTFNNEQCGIKYDVDENTVAMYNGDKTVSLDFDEPCLNANGLGVYADGFFIPDHGPEDLINANGSVATKITEEQILNLFK